MFRSEYLHKNTDKIQWQFVVLYQYSCEGILMAIVNETCR